MGPVRVSTDRRFVLPVPPAALWAHVSRVEQFQDWWPWLRRFEGRALAADQSWRCTVQPPLPYQVRFRIDLDEVEAPVSAQARVSGDIEGWARLAIDPHPEGSDLRLLADLAPSNGFLRVAGRLAAPLVRFGHDWVLDVAVRQFRERAL